MEETVQLILFKALVQWFLRQKKAAEELKEQKGTGLKILIPKQLLQRLPIALVKVKSGNNSQNLLNEIRQIIYSLYQSKEITKKGNNNIIKSIKWNCV